MTAEERILSAGWDDVVILDNYSYDDALIGITEDEATEWVDYNTLRALPYLGPDAPLVMYTLPNE